MQQNTCPGFTLYRDDDNDITVYRFQIAAHGVQLAPLLSTTQFARSINLQVMRTFVGVDFYFIWPDRYQWPPGSHSNFTRENSKTICTAAMRVVDFDHLEDEDDPNPIRGVRLLYGGN